MDKLEPYAKRKAMSHAGTAAELATNTSHEGLMARSQVEATLAVAWATIYAGEQNG